MSRTDPDATPMATGTGTALRVCFRHTRRPGQVTADTTDGTAENIVALEDAGITRNRGYRWR